MHDPFCLSARLLADRPGVPAVQSHATLVGVPLVVVPQQPEQGVTADRVTELGLGTHLEPDDVTAGSLAQAVSRVAGDAGVASRVVAMREQALSAGGPVRAADAILRHIR